MWDDLEAAAMKFEKFKASKVIKGSFDDFTPTKLLENYSPHDIEKMRKIGKIIDRREQEKKRAFGAIKLNLYDALQSFINFVKVIFCDKGIAFEDFSRFIEGLEKVAQSKERFKHRQEDIAIDNKFRELCG